MESQEKKTRQHLAAEENRQETGKSLKDATKEDLVKIVPR